MKQLVLTSVFFVGICITCLAQDTDDGTEESVRSRLREYVEAFNSHEATAVVAFWTNDAVSVQEETGERTSGRDALLEEFTQFFDDYPDAVLQGNTENVQPVGSDVAIADGRVTLITDGDSVSETLFTAVLKKQDDGWFIASSHERDVPSPPTAYDALKELEWLVGSWQDQTDGASVDTTVRWSPSRAFLIRSYSAEFEDGEGFTGTQIFGWDPLAKQIHTWTFNSDGSYGDGTVSYNGSEWLVKLNQMQNDGQLASGTMVITRVDDDTLEIQKIGESIDGQPVPASEPITVVRTADAASDPAEEAATEQESSR